MCVCVSDEGRKGGGAFAGVRRAKLVRSLRDRPTFPLVEAAHAIRCECPDFNH